MGSVGRYVSGLCVAIVGLCAAGWLALVPMAFGYRGNSQHKAVLTDRATGAGLALVSLVTLACWVIAWRRTLRADALASATSRRQAPRGGAGRPGDHLRDRGLAGRGAVRAALPAGRRAVDRRGPAGRHRRGGAGRGRAGRLPRGARGPGQGTVCPGRPGPGAGVESWILDYSPP